MWHLSIESHREPCWYFKCRCDMTRLEFLKPPPDGLWEMDQSDIKQRQEIHYNWLVIQLSTDGDPMIEQS